MPGDRRASAPHVLVIGEALVDIVEIGHEQTEHVGGSPANVALGLGRRGVAVGLLAQIAPDARGQMIVDHLRGSGVTVLDQTMTASATSTAKARIGPDGQAEYEFDISWGAFGHPRDVAPRVLHTGSIAAFLDPGAASVLDALRSTHAAEITFDPNIRPALLDHRTAFGRYEAVARMASVVKMSDEDAAWLYPGATGEQVIDATLELGPALVALTSGEHGAVIATPDHRVTIPPVTVATVDTIGAGDTFMASLIHSVLEGGSRGLEHAALERIGREAVRASSITVSRAGADLPWASELTASTRAD